MCRSVHKIIGTSLSGPSWYGLNDVKNHIYKQRDRATEIPLL